MSEPMGKQNIEQLKIFHFGVDQGDCTLIMVRAQGAAPGTRDLWHTISILIDTGKAGETDKVWKAIWKQIVAEGGTKLDFFIISHFDEDHYRHAAGILKIVQNSIVDDVMYEGAEYAWKDELRVVDRIFTGKTHDTYIARDGNTKKEKRELLDSYIRQLSYCRTMATFTDHDLFADAGYELPNFQMLCVAANGYIGDTFEASIQRPESKKPRQPRLQENDFSLAVLVRFGSFRFYSGGDLHGTHDERNPITKVVGSMEEPLAAYLYKTVLRKAQPNARHVCAALVHHHGAKQSTLGTFINYFNPRIAVCSGSASSLASAQKPTSQVIARLRGQRPDGESEDVYPGLKPDEGRTIGRCTLLYTFRIKKSNKVKLDESDKEKCEEPATTDQKRSEWGPCARQDVILHVVDEQGRSPLEPGKQPHIYVSRRERALGSVFAAEGVPKRYEASEVSYETVEGASLAYCDCDRSHEIIRLPTRSQP